MTFGDQFFWVIYPYIILIIFLVGLYYRYQTDQFGWTAKSSEILEKKKLRWGSNLFHAGIMLVLFGHIGGLLIPKSWLESIGISDHSYHTMAIVLGSAAGLMTLVGCIILLLRRLTDPRIRRTSSFGDMLSIILLTLIVVVGMGATLFNAASRSGFDYRETIAPWIRGVLTFTPDGILMKDVPYIFKIHIILALGLFGVFPFTRLVHMLSMPIKYLKRSYVLYRKRR
ncbi:respiratory nitrate reductase subunit gamma [Paenibacillus melissococcoides]|uniref:Respiratory nitrate reductase subunit gamma n=1 Tax=Paenibacillus melissococcoides TaxID=2912268 RepID=A0ABN8U6Q7_9BACL|nr:MULTISPECIES: respiratory nitrate reductase subunit gamma [Paenibacillus]MEB9892129.1 respiratory nitrate reductase subunit gamma [Bacillus cereus]CAH8246739.1 respiratory nitrate reductase subunit gamma [Paenibacillus melissococcoides]CAH8715610.1 respiratory nitrate reductase subunit gamma [Paenibacillus melissococcoides]CAH8716569.1 respiratory nitrate reductase subunit gamma [Paenibacillus melissococcoides]GIO77079.1 nitrate reductase subunit gamma [Paenibacillus dendritiformis]